MTDTIIDRFSTAYQEWVNAGGIVSNFKAHLLAIGALTPGKPDLDFMRSHAETAKRQYNQVLEQIGSGGIATTRGADISLYAGEIDRVFCDNLKSLNIDLVVVGLQRVELAKRQLDILKTAGFKLHTYIYPPSKVLSSYIPEVLKIMDDYSLVNIWVDVEESEVNQAAAIRELNNVPGIRCGIYTSAYMWGRYMNHTTIFSKNPLWYAQYDNIPSMAGFKPFGGWVRPVMKQYNADHPRYDLNVYDPTVY